MVPNIWSRPGDYNSQRVNNLTDENIPHAEKVQMVKNLAAASNLTYVNALHVYCGNVLCHAGMPRM